MKKEQLYCEYLTIFGINFRKKQVIQCKDFIFTYLMIIYNLALQLI